MLPIFVGAWGTGAFGASFASLHTYAMHDFLDPSHELVTFFGNNHKDNKLYILISIYAIYKS